MALTASHTYTGAFYTQGIVSATHHFIGRHSSQQLYGIDHAHQLRTTFITTAYETEAIKTSVFGKATRSAHEFATAWPKTDAADMDLEGLGLRLLLLELALLTGIRTANGSALTAQQSIYHGRAISLTRWVNADTEWYIVPSEHFTTAEMRALRSCVKARCNVLPAYSSAYSGIASGRITFWGNAREAAAAPLLHADCHSALLKLATMQPEPIAWLNRVYTTAAMFFAAPRTSNYWRVGRPRLPARDVQFLDALAVGDNEPVEGVLGDDLRALHTAVRRVREDGSPCASVYARPQHTWTYADTVRVLAYCGSPDQLHEQGPIGRACRTESTSISVTGLRRGSVGIATGNGAAVLTRYFNGTLRAPHALLHTLAHVTPQYIGHYLTLLSAIHDGTCRMNAYAGGVTGSVAACVGLADLGEYDPYSDAAVEEHPEYVSWLGESVPVPELPLAITLMAGYISFKLLKSGDIRLAGSQSSETALQYHREHILCPQTANSLVLGAAGTVNYLTRTSNPAHYLAWTNPSMCTKACLSHIECHALRAIAASAMGRQPQLVVRPPANVTVPAGLPSEKCVPIHFYYDPRSPTGTVSCTLGEYTIPSDPRLLSVTLRMRAAPVVPEPVEDYHVTLPEGEGVVERFPGLIGRVGEDRRYFDAGKAPLKAMRRVTRIIAQELTARAHINGCEAIECALSILMRAGNAPVRGVAVTPASFLTGSGDSAIAVCFGLPGVTATAPKPSNPQGATSGVPDTDQTV